MSSVRTHASRRPRDPQPTRPVPVQDSKSRMRSTLDMTNGIYLIYEALSRARMRKPQEPTSEAFRSARQIAMNSRREQNRQLGHWS